MPSPGISLGALANSVDVFAAALEAQVSGNWKEIANLDQLVVVGARFRSHITLKTPRDRAVNALRFVLTAPESAGLLIDDFALFEDEPTEVSKAPEVVDIMEVVAAHIPKGPRAAGVQVRPPSDDQVSHITGSQ